jgi:PPOX class probable F420-dependent enzyme
MRFVDYLPRVDTCMNPNVSHIAAGVVRDILAGPHLSVLATSDPDGAPQTSVIFITQEGDDILFSTIKGRRKTTNMLRRPGVNVLVHRLPVGEADPPYATISGPVELVDDPDASFHQVMYDIHMGGATPPAEPGAERVIVRMKPDRIYVPPLYETTSGEP